MASHMASGFQHIRRYIISFFYSEQTSSRVRKDKNYYSLSTDREIEAATVRVSGLQMDFNERFDLWSNAAL